MQVSIRPTTIPIHPPRSAEITNPRRSHTAGAKTTTDGYEPILDFFQKTANMKHNSETIPMVDPMMVRKITPLISLYMVGGVLVMDEYDVEDVGMANERLDYDEDVVDCSNRILEITTGMARLKGNLHFTAFPSRRWRNHRVGMEITGLPSKEEPLLYLGNPVKLFANPTEGITVVRIPEFLIKSGVQLGY